MQMDAPRHDGTEFQMLSVNTHTRQTTWRGVAVRFSRAALSV